MSEKKRHTVALAGNPNVGKTVVFNALTGARQRMGNWPGVTVEKKTGIFRYRDEEFEVVDLPGAYSLSPYSLDEKIARAYIVEEKPEVVVDVVNAASLERNLYLTVQLLETGANVVVALNMMDEAEKKGLKIDVERLSRLLHVPVVPMVATRGEGVEALKEAIYEEMRHHEVHRHMTVGYGDVAEECIVELEKRIEKCPPLRDYNRRWVAIKLMENDTIMVGKAKASGCDSLLKKAEQLRELLKKETGTDPEIFLADKRYEFIDRVMDEVVHGGTEAWTFSDMLDEVFTHKIFGVPVFLLFMWAAFQFTFGVAAPFVDAIDIFFSWLSEIAANSISNPAVSSLVADGIISGVGSVIIFLPNIFLLFFVLSLLEDSGYLARAAFVMDRFMYRIGLQGKSFVPLLFGFGCNVPAIMATRTIEGEKDRIITILITPLMSCSARLPVYILFASAFFIGYEGTVIFSMYIMGILLAVLMALLLRRFVLRGKPAPLIIEMPPYRMPSLKSSVMRMWVNGSLFLKKAGTVIFGGVVIVWFLSTYPGGPGSDIETSYIAVLGKILQPLFAPMGWDWKAVAALMFGFVAKEIVVGAYGAFYGISGAEETNTSLQTALSSSFTPVGAYAYMAFVLTYVPCLPTIAAIRTETNSWKWALFAVAYLLSLAYILALVITFVGNLIFHAGVGVEL